MEPDRSGSSGEREGGGGISHIHIPAHESNVIRLPHVHKLVTVGIRFTS